MMWITVNYLQFSVYITIIYVILYWIWQGYFTKGLPFREKSLPPGTMGLPFLGHTLQFIKKKFQLFDELHERYGDIAKLHLLGNPTIRVRGPEALATVLKTKCSFIQSLWPKSTQLLLGNETVSMSHGDLHKKRKAILARQLSSQKICNSVPMITKTIRQHLELWSNESSVPLYRSMSTLQVHIVLEFFLQRSIPMDLIRPIAPLAEVFSDSIFSIPLNIPGLAFRKGCKCREELVKYLSPLIKTYSNYGCPYSREVNNNASKSAKLNEDFLIEMLVTGRESNTSAGCNLAIYLAKAQRVLQKLRGEVLKADNSGIDANNESSSIDTSKNIIYADWIVREVLRLRPPVGGGFRRAKKSFDLIGYHVPKDWTVVYSIRNTHEAQDLPFSRDFLPERWHPNNPHKPDARRYAYVPFGDGVRACPGRLLARTVQRCLAIEISRAYDLKLLEGDFGPVPGKGTPRPSDDARVSFIPLNNQSLIENRSC